MNVCEVCGMPRIGHGMECRSLMGVEEERDELKRKLATFDLIEGQKAEVIRWHKIEEKKPARSDFFMIALASGVIAEAPWLMSSGCFQHGAREFVTHWAEKLTHPEKL